MTTKARYGLLYSEFEFSPYIRIRFERIVILVATFPLLAFIFCITYSVLFNFDLATYTHCQVYNVLPSVSAAIGSFSPQREVWQAAIAFSLLPRLYVAIEYLNHHHNVLSQKDIWLGYVVCFLHIVENLALMTLSVFTSSRFYEVHKGAFTTFLVVSEVYMILVCLLQKRYKRSQRVSLKVKRRCLVINILFLMVAMYCFMRHNSLCEPYVYSFFALSEYIVVLSNMAFHLTAYLDFRNKDLVIYKYGVALTER